MGSAENFELWHPHCVCVCVWVCVCVCVCENCRAYVVKYNCQLTFCNDYNWKNYMFRHSLAIVMFPSREVTVLLYIYILGL